MSPYILLFLSACPSEGEGMVVPVCSLAGIANGGVMLIREGKISRPIS